jgi:hypothetical protein
MPRQGVLPHDLVHYVVEDGLALRGGFLGLVAQGADAGFVMEMTHHPEKRDAELEAIHVEAMVEALQTQLWAGVFDQEAFAYGLQTAAVARGVSPPELPQEDLCQMLFQRAVELNNKWTLVQVYSAMELHFEQDLA